jgi:hypothetical protein
MCDDLYAFDPICYKNEFIFQTSCHAGCSDLSMQTFARCIVLETLVGFSVNNNTNLLEKCSRSAQNCVKSLMPVYLPGFCILFLSSLTILPLMLVLLDSVDEENQSLVLGMRSFLTRLFGILKKSFTKIKKICITQFFI